MTIRADLILQQLGIRRWIPRAQGHVTASTHLIWQNNEPNPEHSMFKQSDAQVIEPLKSTDAVPVKTTLEIQKAHQADTEHRINQLSNLPSSQPSPAIQTSSTLQTKIPNHTHHQPTVNTIQTASSAFQIELLQHTQFLICAVVQDTQQMEIWRNIQRASQTESLQLKWPVEIKDWQVTDAALQSYLNGFLSAQQSRVLMTLGDIHIPIIEQQIAPQYRFAALAEMLQQPILKRELWQVIQKFLR